jgi:hypothetical protein
MTVVFTNPQGRNLTPAQAMELDDNYFGSKPLGYFFSRIASSLISSGERSRPIPRKGWVVRLLLHLGSPVSLAF